MSGMRKAVKKPPPRQAEAGSPLQVVVTTLVPAPYDLTRDLPVLVRPCDGSFVASFVDANVNASGETVHGAVENLKDLLIALFERLGRERDVLGKGPAKQLAVLETVLRPKGKHGHADKTTRAKARA